MASRSDQAVNYFVSRGYTRNQAYGIVGNLMQESGLNPLAVGDGGTSFGIMQAHKSRANALKRFGGDNWQDFGVQLAFIDHELNTTEIGTKTRLKRASTVDEAVSAFIGYERPSGWSASNPAGGHGYTNRLNYARQLAGGSSFAGDTTVASMSGGTSTNTGVDPLSMPSGVFGGGILGTIMQLITGAANPVGAGAAIGDVAAEETKQTVSEMSEEFWNWFLSILPAIGLVLVALFFAFVGVKSFASTGAATK